MWKSGSRKSSLKEKRGSGGEPPEKKERTESPEEVRSRSPVRKLENDLKGNAAEVESKSNEPGTGSVVMDFDLMSPLRHPPGFVPEEVDGKLPAWTGGAGREEKEKDEEGRKGGGGKGEDGKRGEDEASIAIVLKELREMRLDVDSKFSIVESSLLHFKNELAQLRQEMVSKQMFDQLENRVNKLERDGLTIPDLSFLRQQVSKLDPANRSLRIRGFKESNISEREDRVGKFLKEEGISQTSIDHIFKGPHGKRELTDICIVEFASNDKRESALKQFEKKSKSDDQNLKGLNIDRVKSQIQLKRNTALRDVLMKIKNDSRNKNKSCEIIWKKSDPKNKDREIHVDNVPVFRQSSIDVQGIFLPPFENLTL